MHAYQDLLRRILDEGEWYENRTGVRCVGVFGHQMSFDLAKGFPLVTTKSVHFPSVVAELLFFVGGYTDVRWLQDRKCRIWNEWATAEQCAKRGQPEFDLGPIYGFQWRHFGATYRGMKGEQEGSTDYAGEGVDQLLWAQQQLRENPDSRQIIVSAWNPVDRPNQALPPCHVLMHFRAIGGRLHCSLFQRSCDSFLGVPFNIASYSLLTLMMAQTTGLEPGTFVHFLSDAHLYENHLDQVREQLAREPRALPTVRLNPDVRCVTGFRTEDVELVGYEPHPKLTGTVAV
ncbi:MAG: thymidylate synthase [Planctomycetota bacterium]|nr:thymidylate synthase [Planctomycetota bacterium]